MSTSVKSREWSMGAILGRRPNNWGLEYHDDQKSIDLAFATRRILSAKQHKCNSGGSELLCQTRTTEKIPRRRDRLLPFHWLA